MSVVEKSSRPGSIAPNSPKHSPQSNRAWEFASWQPFKEHCYQLWGNRFYCFTICCTIQSVFPKIKIERKFIRNFYKLVYFPNWKLKNIQEYLINIDKIKLQVLQSFHWVLLSSHNIIHNIFCRIRIIIVFLGNFYY